MLSIRRIIAGLAGTMIGLMGVGVALGYINAMLATAPSLGNLAKLSGAPQLAAAQTTPHWWEGLTRQSEQLLAEVETVAQGGILRVNPRDRKQLQNHFAALDYALPAAGEPAGKLHDVPRLYLRSLPHDLASGDSSLERKSDFVKVMLPLVLAGNEKIQADRARIEKFARQVQGGGGLYAVNKAWLVQLAAEYGLEDFNPATGDWEELLRRVDTVPTSLALAQAALESGWGTSRFAKQGNAVFGQWSWKPGSGLVPAGRAPDEGHEVRRFGQLSESVGAYLHNLNTHALYGKFRARRAGARERGVMASGMELVKYLGRYSTEGGKYIDEVRGIIEKNLLQDMDAARLRPARADQLTSS